jgi:hypothetical protein
LGFAQSTVRNRNLESTSSVFDMDMKPELPIQREDKSERSEADQEFSPSNLISFQTVQTDSQSAASGRNYGGAHTLLSMNYTESQSAGQPGDVHVNQEDTATVEQRHVEAGNCDDDDEDEDERIRKNMWMRMAAALGDDEDDLLPTYAQPEIQIPVPASPTSDVNLEIPTEFQINRRRDRGKGI